MLNLILYLFLITAKLNILILIKEIFDSANNYVKLIFTLKMRAALSFRSQLNQAATIIIWVRRIRVMETNVVFYILFLTLLLLAE